MKKSKILIYGVFTTFILLLSTFLSKKFPTILNSLIIPLFWIFITLIIILTYGITDKRIKAKTDKRETVLIIIICYIVVDFFLGVIFGYSKSIFNHTALGYIKNIWMFVIPLILKEFSRYHLVSNVKKKHEFIWLILIFSLLEFNFSNILDNFQNNELIFRFLVNTVFIVLVKNILLTYLVKIGGMTLSLSYLLPILFFDLVMPILPNYDAFVSTILDLLLILVLYIFTSKIHIEKTEKISRRNLKKYSPVKTIPFVLIVMFIAAFIIGVFKYVPVAIMSNSMSSLINRGDVVIIEKINEKNIDNLKLNDIIEYSMDNYKVIHRIVKIEIINDNKLYTTKGDNNDEIDKKKVTSDQIIGKAIVKIPKIGYPSVWLNEALNKNQNIEVET